MHKKRVVFRKCPQSSLNVAVEIKHCESWIESQDSLTEEDQ